MYVFAGWDHGGRGWAQVSIALGRFIAFKGLD